MKKNSNIVKILTIFLFIIIFFNIFSYAVVGEDYLGTALNASGGHSAAANATSAIISALRVLGVSVGLIVILWLAIKYMTSAPEGKADVVKTAVPFLIGALIFFGAGTILSWISNMI